MVSLLAEVFNRQRADDQAQKDLARQTITAYVVLLRKAATGKTGKADGAAMADLCAVLKISEARLRQDVEVVGEAGRAEKTIHDGAAAEAKKDAALEQIKAEEQRLRDEMIVLKRRRSGILSASRDLGQARATLERLAGARPELFITGKDSIPKLIGK